MGDSVEEQLLRLSPEDRDFVLGLDLSPECVSQMGVDELGQLIQRMFRIGEQLGVDEMPPIRGGRLVPMHSDGGRLTRPRTFRLQRDTGVAGTGMWWFGWSIEDFGWHSVPGGVELGCQAYTASQLMCRVIFQPDLLPDFRLDVKDRSVVELGTGIGMLGVVAAQRAARVVLTDHDPTVLRMAFVNAQLNGRGRTQVESLEWGQEQAASFREKFGRFDIVVASDVVYSHSVSKPLFDCVDELMTSETGGICLLGFVERTCDHDMDLVGEIRGAAKDHGFVERCQPVPLVDALEYKVNLPEGDMRILMFVFVREAVEPSAP